MIAKDPVHLKQILISLGLTKESEDNGEFRIQRQPPKVVYASEVHFGTTSTPWGKWTPLQDWGKK
jgi:hypothetical protein